MLPFARYDTKKIHWKDLQSAMKHHDTEYWNFIRSLGINYIK